MTVVKVNGGSVPASKTIVGTNSSGQIVDASSATLANNTTGYAEANYIANTTVAVTSGTQGANSCSSASTVSMTNLTTSMVARVGYSANPASLTGWGSSGGMVFQAWPSAAGTMSWIVCNQASSSITYSAITFNLGAR
jgi:hypothetical protein